MKRIDCLCQQALLGLSALFFLLLAPQPASAFTANNLGDFQNISVIEVSGSYDAIDNYGQPEMSARRTLAQEFYRTHGDDYDFLVIFTNFDFTLPAGAKAFFSPAKNDVQGIGLPLNDYTRSYTPDGSALSRFEGTIDMANISSHVLEPTDPDFDDTLLTLTHEMLHRWAAYVQFLDDAAPSNALLGLDDAHWSFLLDSGGSSLYGNNWLDNGDGTFTSIQPEQGRDNEPIGRIFNPLELYLMGLYNSAQVPPMTLLVSPEIDPTRLPEIGATISATPTTVTIQDIIAVEGPRVPGAAASRKEFRTAFIYAVTPGSWSASNPEDFSQLSAINRLQSEWEKRFSILTDGAGLVRTSFVLEDDGAEANPGITVPTTTPALLPSVNNGVDWLINSQNDSGFWQDQVGTEQRDTATAVMALEDFTAGVLSVQKGQDWLAASPVKNHDFLARKVMSLNGAGVAEVLSRQNYDGGWGSLPGYMSNPLDTALTVQALTANGLFDGVEVTAAISYLLAAQNPDGGWPVGNGASMVQPTAHALLALSMVQDDVLVPAITTAHDWLGAKQNLDGGFGNSPSTAYDTAVALSALKKTGAPQIKTDQAVTYLLNEQADNGSWNVSSFQTALAVQALYLGTVQADLSVEAADISIRPFPVAAMPADVTLSALIHNSGEQEVAAARVVLYAGDPAHGVVAGETEVSVPGHSSTQVDFPVHFATAGEAVFSVVIDPEQSVAEASEQNNQALTSFSVGVLPTVSLSLDVASGAEATTNVAVEVTLSHQWNQTVSVMVAADPSSTASQGTDFQLENGLVTFLPGETSKVISLTVIDDAVVEADESVRLMLTDPVNAVLGEDQVAYSIENDDLPPWLELSSPIDGEVYTTRQPYLRYETNMPEAQIEVLVDGSAVGTRNQEPLPVMASGSHLLRVVITEGSSIVVEEQVSFEIDDTGLSPDLVWKDQLLGPDASGKTYGCMEYSSDNGLYAVRKFEQDLSVVKIDQKGATLWSIPGLSSCSGSASTGDAYLILDGGSIRKYSDQVNSQGKLAHIIDVPDYESSFWGEFAVDAAGDYYLLGQTVEGISKNDVIDEYNIQVAKLDVLGNLLWRQVIASEMTDVAADIVADASGNVYLLGHTSGFLGPDGGSNLGQTDIFLHKLDPAGNLLWRKQLGTAQADEGRSLAIDSQGNLLLLGATYGSFDGTAPTYEHDLFLLKLAPDGTELWLSQNHAISNGRHLAVAKDDEVVVAGTYGSELDGFAALTPKWSRYAVDGSLLWTGVVDSGPMSYNDRVNGLVVDPYGNLFVSVGYIFSNYSTGLWESRGFLAKYNAGLDFSPPLLTVAPSLYDPANRTLKLAGNHEYYTELEVRVDTAATVVTSNSADSTAWSGTVSNLYPGQHKLTVEAVDLADGTSAHQEIFLHIAPPTPFQPGTTLQSGTVDREYVYSSAITDQDTFHLAGRVRSSTYMYDDVVSWQAALSGEAERLIHLDMDNVESGKVVTVDAAGNLYLGWEVSGNVQLGKFDAAGNSLWTADYSSRKGNQYVEGMAVDAAGNVFIAGYTEDSPDRNVLHGGGLDYFLVKFDSSGNYLWSRLSGPGHPEDQAVYGLDLDAVGNVYLAGFSQGDLHGVPSLSSAFVEKYDNDGNLLWVEVVEDDLPGVAKDVVVDQSGNLYLAGEVDYLRGGEKDLFLCKYAPSKERSWFKTFGGYLNDYARDLSLDRDGNLLFAALMNRDSYFKSDIYWAKYAPDGGVLWAERFDADSGSDIAGIHATSTGSIVLAGYTNLSLGATSFGAEDLFLREYVSPSGPELAVDPVVSPTAVQSVLLTGRADPTALISINADASEVSFGPISLNSVSGAWSCQVSGLVANEDNVLTVQASDGYGETRRTVTIYVDTLPPELVVNPVAAVTELLSQTLSGTVEVGAALRVQVNSGAASAVVPESDGAWSHLIALVEGDNLITVSATDSLGHETTETILITSEPPPPPAMTLVPAQLLENQPAEIVLTLEHFADSADGIQIEIVRDVLYDGLSADDFTVLSFVLTDGVLSEDPNVPGDEDGLTNGSIVTTLNYNYINDVQMAPGPYHVVATTKPQAAIASLEISPVSASQNVYGDLIDEEYRFIYGATVQLFDKWGNSYGFSSDPDFNFGVQRPGEYYILPYVKNMFLDKAVNQLLQLEQDQIASVFLEMSDAGAKIVRGRVLDAISAESVGAGILVRAENDRYLAAAVTNSDGRYSLSLPEGSFDFYLDASSSQGVWAKGYLAPREPVATLEVSGYTENHDLLLDKATATVCGKVSDQWQLGVAGIPLESFSVAQPSLAGKAITDSHGDYCIGLAAPGDWRVDLNHKATQALGYVGTTAAGFAEHSGRYLNNDLTLYAVDATITGSVQAAAGQPVADMAINLSHQESGVDISGKTAADGTYQLGAFAGTWRVTVDTAGSEYEPVAPLELYLLADQVTSHDFSLLLLAEPPEVTINAVVSPTELNWQTISGTRSTDAIITVVADSSAFVESVNYPTETTWAASLNSLSLGLNTLTVTADNGSRTESVSTEIFYDPDYKANTIIVASAKYDVRKTTLSVEASSLYPDANFVLEYAGQTVPMNFAKLFKGRYLWNYIDTAVAVDPVTVTVSGPEGSLDAAVAVK